MFKRFLIAFILLVIVVGGLVGYNLFRDRMIQDFFANMPVQPVAVSTVKLEPTDWTPSIEAIGTMSAINGVDLTVEVAGIVDEIHFQANDRVEKGDVLVQLDDATQRADLAAAQAQADLDKTNLQRALELQRRQVGTEVNVESARAAADASAAEVEKAQASLDQKQLKAPFAGVAGIPRVVLGQYITPGTTVATLQDVDTMRVDFTVPEQEFGLLKIGQPVRLGSDEQNLSYTGAIRGIDPKIDPSSRLANVRAEVANPDGRLVPGQFVEVEVVQPEESDVLALPQTAVVTSLYGDYAYVVRPAENGEDGAEQPSLVVKQVFVKTGRRSGAEVEIVEGLSAGDQVVTAGQNRLSNGASVTVADGEGRGAKTQESAKVTRK
ncbi:efflux RND transporter periplasmic adaptor subunit [Chelativorans salis]|uniref:Efflux RND transporter periplasmic adaptor subunit n=1 Tax=Chelativorans salis TaxID=2978478 RepID=A0ABT2LW26_9HYPH|nr:efflux RND transporter periplasmic adaptor subunit [Chelativorans sp. EGI FJ00035]MCT7378601.1 efflux RND transporter periplasmic adaptor subunit [Chelativorans sp. EGI FJ00035]